MPILMGSELWVKKCISIYLKPRFQFSPNEHGQESVQGEPIKCPVLMYLIKRTDQRIVFRQQVIGLPVGDESLNHVINVLQ